MSSVNSHASVERVRDTHEHVVNQNEPQKGLSVSASKAGGGKAPKKQATIRRGQESDPITHRRPRRQPAAGKGEVDTGLAAKKRAWDEVDDGETELQDGRSGILKKSK